MVVSPARASNLRMPSVTSPASETSTRQMRVSSRIRLLKVFAKIKPVLLLDNSLPTCLQTVFVMATCVYETEFLKLQFTTKNVIFDQLYRLIASGIFLGPSFQN